MVETATDLVVGEERRTGKHMRRVDGRKPRSDIGKASPERRRSPEHYQRMQEAMRRVKRMNKIVQLMQDSVPMTRAQIDTIRIALEGISVLGETDSSGEQVAGAA